MQDLNDLTYTCSCVAAQKAITQAKKAEYVKLARKLLQYGANANVRDSYGWAITQAIRAGYEVLAIELLEGGADPDSTDCYGAALTQAQTHGQEKLERVLLDRVVVASQATQASSRYSRITINGELGPGTRVEISTPNASSQIIVPKHGGRNVSGSGLFLFVAH